MYPILNSTNLDNMYENLEKCGTLLRLDKNIKPGRWKCATVTKQEVELLTSVTKLRHGKILEITNENIIFNDTKINTIKNEICVDCSANGLAARTSVQIFNGKNITLQSVKQCQQVFSSALIAYCELMLKNDSDKNFYCIPVPHPF